MKKIIDALKNAWDWADGKKTTIGVVAWLATRLISATGIVNPEYTGIIQDGIEYWLFGSILHKGIKATSHKK